METKQNLISYIFAAFLINTLIGIFILGIFLIIRKIRKDRINYLNISNQIIMTNTLPVSHSYSINSLINFYKFSKDISIFGESNYEGFLYLYFLKKISVLCLKITPLSIIFYILSENMLLLFSSFSIQYEISKAIYSLIVFFIFHFFLRNFYDQIYKYSDGRKNNSNSVMLSNFKINNILQTKTYFDESLKYIIKDNFYSLIVIPDNIKKIEKIYKELEEIVIEINSLNLYSKRTATIIKYTKDNIIRCRDIDKELLYYVNTTLKDNFVIKKISDDYFLKKRLLEYYLNETNINSLNIAFVIFKKLIDKDNLINSLKLYIKDINICISKHQDDIIWNKLEYINYYHKLRMIAITFILLIISFKILTPAILYSYINPLLIDLTENNSFLYKLELTYLYPFLVTCFNSFLIPYGAFYLTYFEKNWIKSELTLSLLYKNFIAMILGTIIIPLSANISKINLFDWDELRKIINNQNYYMIQYLIQVSLISNMLQFLAIPQTIMQLYYKKIIVNYFDFGYNYAYILLIVLILMSFLTSLPLFSILGFIFFRIKYYTDKYNLSFIFSVEFDSGGKLSMKCLYITFLLFIIFQIISLVHLSKILKLILFVIYLIFDIILIIHILIHELKIKNENFNFSLINKLKILNQTSNFFDINFNLRETISFDDRELSFDFIPPEYLREYFYNRK